jgi:hypothetical protein
LSIEFHSHAQTSKSLLGRFYSVTVVIRCHRNTENSAWRSLPPARTMTKSVI